MIKVSTLKDFIEANPLMGWSEMGRKFSVSRQTLREKYAAHPDEVLIVGDTLYPSSRRFNRNNSQKSV